MSSKNIIILLVASIVALLILAGISVNIDKFSKTEPLMKTLPVEDGGMRVFR